MTELDKLAPAVVKLQSLLSPVDKSADNPFFKSKYAPLPEVRAALQPLLASCDLARVAQTIWFKITPQFACPEFVYNTESKKKKSQGRRRKA